MSLNPHSQYASYGQSGALVKPSRESEYDVLGRVTAKLRLAQNDPADFAQTAHAIDENRRLWGMIAMSMADPKNSFPDELKAQLFYLYRFTIAHSRKVLKKEAQPSPLVDVNLAVMRGLCPEITP